MHVVCVINPHAGSRQAAGVVADAVHEVADRSGWDLVCVLTQGRGHATSLAKDAAGRADLVIAAGGDGTIHEVACGLMDGQTPLGIIPVGSGNGLARALGIPTDLQRAAEALPSGRASSIDVGVVNGVPFLSTAGVGLDAHIARRFATGKHRRGILPYVWYGLREWFAYQPEELRIDIGVDASRERPLLLVVANTDQYGAGAVIAPGAKPDDGKLSVCRIMPMSTVRALLTLPRLFNGTLERSSCFRATEATEVTVHRERAGPIQVDGEPMDAAPVLHFRVLPGALKVWRPAPTG